MVLLGRSRWGTCILSLTSQGISGREFGVANVRLAAVIEGYVEHVALGSTGLFLRFAAIENISEDFAGLLGLRVAILTHDALSKENSKDDAEDSEGADDDLDTILNSRRLHVVVKFLGAAHVKEDLVGVSS